MERQVFFTSESLRITGLLASREGARAVVITHPHPLYGGDMRNPVVTAVQQAYFQSGYATLRFDFRGVGGSEGVYGGGRGEGADALAAVGWLRERGHAAVDLAGYSFGAWVNAHLPPEATGRGRMVMVSPPVALMDFSDVGAVETLDLVVTGERDDIAPPRTLETMVAAWNSRAVLETVSGADHFFTGRLDRLAGTLSTALRADRGPDPAANP